MTCQAITYRPNDAPAPCDRESEDGSMFCYYHGKMFQGHLAPFFEEASVRTAAGVSVYSPGSQKRRKK